MPPCQAVYIKHSGCASQVMPPGHPDCTDDSAHVHHLTNVLRIYLASESNSLSPTCLMNEVSYVIVLPLLSLQRFMCFSCCITSHALSLISANPWCCLVSNTLVLLVACAGLAACACCNTAGEWQLMPSKGQSVLSRSDAAPPSSSSIGCIATPAGSGRLGTTEAQLPALYASARSLLFRIAVQTGHHGAQVSCANNAITISSKSNRSNRSNNTLHGSVTSILQQVC